MPTIDITNKMAEMNRNELADYYGMSESDASKYSKFIKPYDNYQEQQLQEQFGFKRTSLFEQGQRSLLDLNKKSKNLESQQGFASSGVTKRTASKQSENLRTDFKSQYGSLMSGLDSGIENLRKQFQEKTDERMARLAELGVDFGIGGMQTDILKNEGGGFFGMGDLGFLGRYNPETGEFEGGVDFSNININP